MSRLHVDIETFCELDLTKVGLYRYIEHESFEILLVSWAIDDDEIIVEDIYKNGKFSRELSAHLSNPLIKKCAHNSPFEQQSFAKYGFETSFLEWHCTLVKAAYCGLPLSLGQVSKVLNLGDQGKEASGKALIKFFCMPCKPSKKNGGVTRNLPRAHPEKWREFKSYVKGDTRAERIIDNKLSYVTIPNWERNVFALNEKINKRGVKIDINLASKAVELHEICNAGLSAKIKELTGVDNPNSNPQLTAWFSSELGREVTSLNKKEIPALKGKSKLVDRVIHLRSQLAKTAIKKFYTMLVSVCADGRGRGYFQFYGANRTGRWAGRLVQLQNLAKNFLKDLEDCRNEVLAGEHTLLEILYPSTNFVLAQLVRTAFVASPGKTLAVADFSSIEARVIAWLAGEQWRLDVFNGDGKIYEKSASMMFGIPLEQIDKALRQKGKIAELALGYGGGIGALIQMGGEAMGLTTEEMSRIVKLWRKASPAIVNLWYGLEKAAISAITRQGKVIRYKKGIQFYQDGENLQIKLPSGRSLFYRGAKLGKNRFGKAGIKYQGMDQITKKWVWLETYGGKLAENIVQAIARDLLAIAMLRLDRAEFDIVLHVHDEAACEVDIWKSKEELARMCEIMTKKISWAEGLPMGADGYTTKFYKKED